LAGRNDDLVVDIGRVHDEFDVKVEVVFHDATDNIGRNIILRMTEVGIFIDCRAAGIPSYRLARRIDWDEVILAPRQAVVDLQSGQMCVRSDLGADP
jgi:hypothetical protein